MLADTGSSRTDVLAGIFGNSDGDVFISILCLENGICFYHFTARSIDSAFPQTMDGCFNGIIGVDLLRSFDLILDYKSELIYFKISLKTARPVW
jgi:hypothetical protein